MSEENVELVRAAWEAVMREWDLAGAEQLLDPAVEFHGTVGGLREGIISRGLEQLRHDLHEEDLEAWDARRFESEGFIDAGNHVVVLMHEFRRGRGSGVEIETDTAMIFEVRNGRVIRIQGYMDREKALEAAGLTEEAMSQENLEIVRREYERINTDYKAEYEGQREAFDPDYEFDATDVAAGVGITAGYDAVRDALHDYWDMFEDFHIKLKEVLHAADNRVVTAVRDGGRMKGSDAEVWNDLFHVWTFRDGKVIRVSAHNDRSRALEAAGLTE